MGISDIISMKRFLMLVVACLVSAGTIQAQKPGATKPVAVSKQAVKQGETAQEKAKTQVAKISAACGLKPEQVTKLTAAFVEYYTKHDALKKQKDILDKGTYDDRSDAMKKTRDGVIKSTLTASQYKQWNAAKDKAKKESKNDKSEE